MDLWRQHFDDIRQKLVTRGHQHVAASVQFMPAANTQRLFHHRIRFDVYESFRATDMVNVIGCEDCAERRMPFQNALSAFGRKVLQVNDNGAKLDGFPTVLQQKHDNTSERIPLYLSLYHANFDRTAM